MYNPFQEFIQQELDLSLLDEPAALEAILSSYQRYPTEALAAIATERMLPLIRILQDESDVVRALLLALITFIHVEGDGPELEEW